MATVDEILASMPDMDVARSTDEILVIDANTRQINIPGSELIFGVEADAGSECKYFLCSRYVGNNIDLASCFLRVNYRNANGEIDEYLVDDVAVNGDNVTFSWVVSPKAVSHKGMVAFVVCAIGANLKVAWHTTLASGIVLEGLEPDNSHVEAQTSDVVAQLIAMVEAQTAAVEAEGATQIKAVQTAAKTAELASVAEIEAKGVNTRESIPDDYTALSEAVDGLVRGRAGAIVCEAEGSAVAVNDASDLPMQGLKIFGRSTQDGVPSPDAPVEIVSVEKPVVTVAGKNLCNMKAFGSMGMNGTANIYDPDTHTITMTADSTTSAGRYGSPVNTLPVGKKCTVSFDIRGTSGKKVNCGWDKAKTSIILSDDFVRYSSTLVITSQREAISFYTVHANLGGLAAGEYMQFANVQIEYGDVATEYEEYQTTHTLSTTHTLPGIPVTSGGNYTDSDGQQWICDEVDLERGVYVQRCNVVEFDGTNHSFYTGRHTNGQLYVGISDFDIERNSRLISSHYKSAIWSNNNGEVYCSNDVVIVTDNRFTSVSEAKRCFGETPVVFVYALETPIETPLSETEIAAYRALHSNKPNTTILNDAGAHMAVAYAADTKLYIDNKIAALLGG